MSNLARGACDISGNLINGTPPSAPPSSALVRELQAAKPITLTLPEPELAADPSAARKTKAGWKKWFGIFCALIFAITNSLLSVFVQLLPNLHPILQSMWRQLVNILATLIFFAVFKLVQNNGCNGSSTGTPGTEIVTIGKEEVQQQRSGCSPLCKSGTWTMIAKLTALGILTAMAMITHDLPLLYMSIADATVIAYLYIVFALILAHFMLQEKCLITQSLMAGVIIFGAAVISRPPFLSGQTEFNKSLLLGIGILVINGVTGAATSIFLRKFRQYNFITVMLITNFTALLILVSIVFALGLFELPASSIDLWLLVASGLATAVNHVVKILALKFEKVGTASLVFCADVPFAFAWQIVIFEMLPDKWTILGTMLVCTGVLVTSVGKLVDELPSGSATRKRLWFLLK